MCRVISCTLFVRAGDVGVCIVVSLFAFVCSLFFVRFRRFRASCMCLMSSLIFSSLSADSALDSPHFRAVISIRPVIQVRTVFTALTGRGCRRGG